jgi:hypothetical protein
MVHGWRFHNLKGSNGKENVMSYAKSIDMEKLLLEQNSKAVHAGSIATEGLLKKALRILGESYQRYDRNLNELEPKLWGFMQ